jgi:hypothetical protein
MEPIGLDPNDPQRMNFGRLQFLGAFHLRSQDKRFGGLSGLAAGSDGLLYAISDRGFWISARPHFDSEGRLSDLSEWQIAPLLTLSKTPVKNGLTDAEGLARAPDGSLLVSFEHTHRIWRYPRPPETLGGAPAPVRLPKELLAAPPNGGLEAISARPDGRILAIAEQLEARNGGLAAWLIDKEKSEALSYIAAPGFHPSDATTLPNGDALVLERRYQMPLTFAARLSLIRSSEIRPGAALRGEEVLRLESPLRTENFEGVAAMDTPQGTTIFLVSDDNYFAFQRTLLLQFLLPTSGNRVD